MELNLISPLVHKKFDVSWLEINTAVGNFVIQTGHAPTIMTLAAQQKLTFCLNNGKRESIIIKQGVIHITRTIATVILNEL